MRLLLSGPVRFFHGRQLAPREWVNLGKDADGTNGGRVLSVYPATEGLSVKVIRGLIEAHLDVLLPQVEEYLPALQADAGVPPPVAPAAVTGLFCLARWRAARVRERCSYPASPRRQLAASGHRVPTRELTSRFREALPFQLTKAQVRCVREIVADMCSDSRMHRLLQGDVGAGKTVVAVFAALLAMENGYQVAIMAPTELLAEQHARTLDKLLAPLGIIPVLITGSRSAKERKLAATRLESGEPLIAVGTHALVADGTKFAKLGLAIIDEQHRFGVDQRRILSEARGAAIKPDVLLMSATPIPRSLALTMYGDLGVSILDERPPAASR
jgi:ATP-dependent DNA helicase RecG